MTAKAEISRNGCTLTIRVPFAFHRRGGKKLIIAPVGAEAWAPPRPRVDSTIVKALARAYRWKRMLESGDYSTIQDLADAEKINPSYVSRVLRITLLAPDIVGAILDGRQSTELQLDDLLKPLPVEWERQRRLVGLVT